MASDAVQRSDAVQLKRDGHVAILTLNRPDNLNAMTREMVAEMHATLDELADSFPDVRAVVLTGNGRGFCAGTDIKALTARVTGDQPPPAPRDPSEPREPNIGDLGTKIYNLPQAVIAAVNGVAVGAGFALVLASDLRIAARSAKLGGIFIDRSLPPDGGSSYTLANIVGPTVAAEVLYTGRIYSSDWALGVGLLSSVVDDDQLLAAATTLAQEIAGKPPIALRETKQLLHAYGPQLATAVDREMDAVGVLGKTEDSIEAMKSFSEKRPAVYHGR
jgi:enoyl-CoA hydratase